MSSFFSSKAKVKSLLLKDSSHYCLFYRRIESYGCRGGIRTHDERLMKTLSYRCSTLRYLWNSKGLKSVPALLFSRAFTSTPKDKGFSLFHTHNATLIFFLKRKMRAIPLNCGLWESNPVFLGYEPSV